MDYVYELKTGLFTWISLTAGLVGLLFYCFVYGIHPGLTFWCYCAQQTFKLTERRRDGLTTH